MNHLSFTWTWCRHKKWYTISGLISSIKRKKKKEKETLKTTCYDSSHIINGNRWLSKACWCLPFCSVNVCFSRNFAGGNRNHWPLSLLNVDFQQCFKLWLYLYMYQPKISRGQAYTRYINWNKGNTQHFSFHFFFLLNYFCVYSNKRYWYWR